MHSLNTETISLTGAGPSSFPGLLSFNLPGMSSTGHTGLSSTSLPAVMSSSLNGMSSSILPVGGSSTSDVYTQQISLLKQKLDDEHSNYKRKLQAYQDGQQRQAVLIQKLQSKVTRSAFVFACIIMRLMRTIIFKFL